MGLLTVMTKNWRQNCEFADNIEIFILLLKYIATNTPLVNIIVSTNIDIGTVATNYVDNVVTLSKQGKQRVELYCTVHDTYVRQMSNSHQEVHDLSFILCNN